MSCRMQKWNVLQTFISKDVERFSFPLLYNDMHINPWERKVLLRLRPRVLSIALIVSNLLVG
jgi:hypothetical protein